MFLCMTSSFRFLKLTSSQRFLSRSSFATNSRGLAPYIKSTRSDESEDISSAPDASYPQLKIGTSINVVVTKFGYLGASVDVPEHNLTGLILHKEIDYFVEKRGGKDIELGETLAAFVQRNREGGKVDVSLRPGVFTRINEVKKLVLNALTDSTSKTILLGDKSSALDVSAAFPGVSKTDFRNALGALYRDKLIVPGPRDTSLVANYTEVLKSIEASPTSSSSGARAKQGRVAKGSNATAGPKSAHTLFIGNLSPNSNEEDFRAYLVALFDGGSMIHGIRLAQDERGSSKGFAYVDLKSAEFLPEAVELIKSTPYRGRKLRCDIDSPTTATSAAPASGTDGAIKEKKSAGRVKAPEKNKQLSGETAAKDPITTTTSNTVPSTEAEAPKRARTVKPKPVVSSDEMKAEKVPKSKPAAVLTKASVATRVRAGPESADIPDTKPIQPSPAVVPAVPVEVNAKTKEKKSTVEMKTDRIVRSSDAKKDTKQAKKASTVDYDLDEL